jgi:hypothetical protein
MRAGRREDEKDRVLDREREVEREREPKLLESFSGGKRIRWVSERAAEFIDQH